ncbi:unnamed protein product [Anisakis simplex]|uniref:DUF3967 domain-containing protein n=1 Tax=Anisakis simplex TaxID=6269 RepID=A0A0M3KKA3_ANISI|nr:unnamed protein product [Anisakis simplex]
MLAFAEQRLSTNYHQRIEQAGQNISSDFMANEIIRLQMLRKERSTIKVCLFFFRGISFFTIAQVLFTRVLW